MHVAIIMDGNGRWASRRGLPRTAGHVQGARVVRRVVEAAIRADVATLTLYAFSCDNWGRPPQEVSALLRLLRRYLLGETEHCVENRIRLNVIGRRDRLTAELLRAIEHSERMTSEGVRLHLRIAIDYSARHSILETARRTTGDPAGDADRTDVAAQPSGSLDGNDPAGGTSGAEAEFLKLMNEVNHSNLATEGVDLLIRTGGEKRLSDFLLWECAYAELYFTDCLWPDFDESGLQQALRDYSGRQRRFGRVPDAAGAAS
ncbi:MAG: polyprenyl diphosphate synthase [Steroidobacteraceae bacterium]